MRSASASIGDGIVVGLAGYVSVAAFYGAFDLLASRGALYTVDLLGKAVFRGLHDPAVLQFPMQPDLSAIFWYNALHLVVALTIGLTVTGLAAEAERNARIWPTVRLVLAAGLVVTVLGVGYLTSSFRALLPWWSIAVANVLAAGVGGSYLLWRRPELGRLVLLPTRSATVVR